MMQTVSLIDLLGGVQKAGSVCCKMTKDRFITKYLDTPYSFSPSDGRLHIAAFFQRDEIHTYIHHIDHFFFKRTRKLMHRAHTPTERTASALYILPFFLCVPILRRPSCPRCNASYYIPIHIHTYIQRAASACNIIVQELGNFLILFTLLRRVTGDPKDTVTATVTVALTLCSLTLV